MAPALSNADADKTHELRASAMERTSERRTAISHTDALLGCTAYLELDYFGFHGVAHNLQFPYGDRELKSPRPGASRIDIKHPVTLFDRWSVRVPRYNDPESGCHRIEL